MGKRRASSLCSPSCSSAPPPASRAVVVRPPEAQARLRAWPPRTRPQERTAARAAARTRPCVRPPRPRPVAPLVRPDPGQRARSRCCRRSRANRARSGAQRASPRCRSRSARRRATRPCPMGRSSRSGAWRPPSRRLRGRRACAARPGPRGGRRGGGRRDAGRGRWLPESVSLVFPGQDTPWPSVAPDASAPRRPNRPTRSPESARNVPYEAGTNQPDRWRWACTARSSSAGGRRAGLRAGERVRPRAVLVLARSTPT